MHDRVHPLPPASQALISAALGGLLCLATPACSSNGSPADAGPGGGDATATGSETGTTNPDTPVPDTGCDGGVLAHPTITSSKVDPSMTLAKFTKECDAMGGILEIQPHCGGSNACRGMSYDSETKVLIEHTCRATNSCGGYSCVVCK